MSNQPIPMMVPNIGAQQQAVDITQSQRRVCKCGCEFFVKVSRLGTVSKMASRNRTGQDIIVEFPAYVCRDCGAEFGKEGK